MAISLALETDGFAGINGIVVVYVQQQACKLCNNKQKITLKNRGFFLNELGFLVPLLLRWLRL
jgi:hypothetical protein